MSLVPLRAQRDVVERLARAEWWNGLIELVWNALDAEATKVTVVTKRDGLLQEDAISEIVVGDDGLGFTRDEAERQFGQLGGSWKQTAPGRLTANGKFRLHGEKGQGRFRAFSLGDSIRWESVADDQVEGRQRTTVEITRSDFVHAGVPDEGEPVGADISTGTTVTIYNPTPKALDLLDADVVVAKLAQLLALHLKRYPQISVSFDGIAVDPEDAIERATSYELLVADFPAAEITLDVIEWNQRAEPRVLHLCDSSGMSLSEVPASDIRAPGFNFTAYLRSDLIRDRESELQLADMNDLRAIIEEAKAQIRRHFSLRLEEERVSVIDGWKIEESYPYKGTPESVVEAAERELFEIAAVSINDAHPGLSRADSATRRITLRLLREAVERSPEHLHEILSEVALLSAEQMADFADLLRRTSLPSLIGAARTITDRLEFVEALSKLLFEHTDELKERSQLHKILENELWIFGDQYEHALSERGLTAILRQHIALMGRDDLAVTEPVRMPDGTLRRVDLMLYASILGTGRQRTERLVVELKSPDLVLGNAEFDQIRSYAQRVTAHQAVQATDSSWDFWLIGNEVGPELHDVTHQRHLPEGCALEGPNYTVWIFPWARLIDDVRRRLAFLQDLLEHRPTDEHVLEYLHRKHGDFLPTSLRLDGAGDEVADQLSSA